MAESVTLTAHANAGWLWIAWTPANEDAIIGAVEKLTRYITGIGTMKTQGPQSILYNNRSHPYHNSQSTSVSRCSSSVDAVFPMAMTTHCG
jgi:hypothetical protein